MEEKNGSATKPKPSEAVGKIQKKEKYLSTIILFIFAACEEGPGIFAKAISLGSLLLVIFSLPLSLFFVVKVVQVNQHHH